MEGLHYNRSNCQPTAPLVGRSFFVGELTTGTLIAAAIAVCVGQMALAIPAVLNGLFQLDLGTSAS